METLVKVTRNYQETIPAGIRERLEIKVGDLLSVEIDGDRIILRTVVQEIPIIRLDGELTINDIEGFIEEGLMKNV
nr:AbrB/MazE/SpoVT family DNA-binding domain-containing protein [Vulcanisaeta souniana]